jgi:nucleoside phosphorylase
VVQVDLVKAKEKDGEEIMQRKGHLDSPPMAIRTAIAKLQAEHELNDSRVAALLDQAFQKYPKMKMRYGHPGLARDGDGVKVDIYHTRDKSEIRRDARSTPEIHYGVIASANTLEKSGRHRDSVLAWLRKEGIEPVCFEMEAAGLMNSFPCLVIRGVCDYADEHKNDDWQRYAAATAAAFGKEFLECVDVDEIAITSELGEILRDS